jgi:hypothetical protein
MRDSEREIAGNGASVEFQRPGPAEMQSSELARNGAG